MSSVRAQSVSVSVCGRSLIAHDAQPPALQERILSWSVRGYVCIVRYGISDEGCAAGCSVKPMSFWKYQVNKTPT